MKKFYSLFFALLGLCLCMPVQAQTYKSVVFHKTDGTTLAITVEEGLTTVVGGGEIAMSCGLGVLSLPTTEVSKWTFSTEPGMDFGLAGVSAPEADGDLVEVAVSGGVLTLTGLKAGTNVRLTAVDGRVVAAKTAADDVVTIAADQLPAGVYILTYNDKSLKIALK